GRSRRRHADGPGDRRSHAARLDGPRGGGARGRGPVRRPRRRRSARGGRGDPRRGARGGRPMSLERIRSYLAETSRAAERAAVSCGDEIQAAATAIVDSLRNDGKILFCGNGGSAGDAQHLATEFVSTLTLERTRPAIAALALTTDTSLLTA